jgi:hypothetical protein
MNLRTLSLSLCLGVSLLFGCKNNNETIAPGNCDGASALGDKFTAAAETYAADPTNKAKCNAYIDAYKAYADAVIACTAMYSQKQRDDIVASYTQARDSCK